jgi:hypothetical protein
MAFSVTALGFPDGLVEFQCKLVSRVDGWHRVLRD